MMARYRRMMAMRPIHRLKHVVDSSATLGKGTVLPITLIDAVDAPVIGNVTEVETASKVYGIYLKVLVASNEAHVAGGIPNFYMTITKNPGNNLTMPTPSIVGSSDNKKWVIHQEMTMIQNDGAGGNPTIAFNGVVKIPKAYSRFGPDDNLSVNVLCPAINIAVCIQCIYKEFR